MGKSIFATLSGDRLTLSLAVKHTSCLKILRFSLFGAYFRYFCDYMRVVSTRFSFYIVLEDGILTNRASPLTIRQYPRPFSTLQSFSTTTLKNLSSAEEDHTSTSRRWNTTSKRVSGTIFSSSPSHTLACLITLFVPLFSSKLCLPHFTWKKSYSSCAITRQG
jgi:hypothetical protein